MIVLPKLHHLSNIAARDAASATGQPPLPASGLPLSVVPLSVVPLSGLPLSGLPLSVVPLSVSPLSVSPLSVPFSSGVTSSGGFKGTVAPATSPWLDSSSSRNDLHRATWSGW